MANTYWSWNFRWKSKFNSQLSHGTGLDFGFFAPLALNIGPFFSSVRNGWCFLSFKMWHAAFCRNSNGIASSKGFCWFSPMLFFIIWQYLDKRCKLSRRQAINRIHNTIVFDSLLFIHTHKIYCALAIRSKLAKPSPTEYHIPIN